MAKRLSDDEVTKNMELVMKLVEKFPEPRKSLVKKMFDGPVGETYFTAPASSKEDYHSAYPGGLVQHSLNVVRSLKLLTDTLCPGRYDGQTVVFVGLFHDLGKGSDGENDFYVPNPSEWHRNKLGKLYENNHNSPFMPHHLRSLYILQKYEIVVSSDEYLAILTHDGQYQEANKPFAMKEPELALLLHWSDRFSCEQEKRENKR